MSLERRFWLKVRKSDGCWAWIGNRSQSGHGYGQIISGGKRGRLLAAHRVSWELHHGPIPVGQNVLHHCDNRACVRPDHLFIGGQSENLADMVRKGRCYNAKLQPRDVAEIRRLRMAGVRSAEIASTFSISEAHARKVGAGRAWTHVS